MTVKEIKKLSIDLSEMDKDIMGKAYDIAWDVRQKLWNNEEAEWDMDMEKLETACSDVMHAIAEFSKFFYTDENFASWGRK